MRVFAIVYSILFGMNVYTNDAANAYKYLSIGFSLAFVSWSLPNLWHRRQQVTKVFYYYLSIGFSLALVNWFLPSLWHQHQKLQRFFTIICQSVSP